MSDLRGTGTIADTYDPLPDTRPAPAPLREPATLGDLWSATRVYQRADRSDADELRLQAGYAPIVQALGLGEDQNPAAFYNNDGLHNPMMMRSALGDQSGIFGNMTDRPNQELAIVAEIRRRRAANPQFLAGIPDTVDGLHAYFLDQDRQRRAAAAGTIAASPGGFLAGATQLAAGAFEAMHDPVNIMATAIPGGPTRSIAGVLARGMLINGVVELAQQPIVAQNRHELGEEYSVGEGVQNVLMAAAGGGVIELGLHGAGRGVNALRGGDAAAAGRDILSQMRSSGWDHETIDRIARGLQSPDHGVDVLRDEISRAPNRDLVALFRGLGRPLTPDQDAAINVLEHADEQAASSPYTFGPAGDAAHDVQLDLARRSLLAGTVPPDAPTPSPLTGASVPAPGRPPVSTSGRPPIVPHETSAPMDSEAAIADYMARTRRHESSGRSNAQNQRSSAGGLYQFTDDTFRRYYRQEYGRDPGEHPPAALKYDDEIQTRLMLALTRDNAARLRHAGQAVNPGNLYLMHFAGPGVGEALLRADPAERAADVWMRADPAHARRAIAANPGLIEGKSASEVVAWAHRSVGGSSASVPLRDGIATGGDVTEDPVVAQLRAEALALSQQAIAGEALPNGGAVPPMATRQFRPADLIVDPQTFQFKAGGDEFGVTDRLSGITEWNPIYAGRLVAWEDLGGRVFVADGHQRVGLARRIEAQTGAEIPLDAVVLREADGVTAQDARVWAALKNIAEGTGTATDAAKVIRDAGPEILRDLPPRSALVRDGAALSRLSDDAFGAVWNGRISSDLAAVVGHLVDNPDAHASMIDLLLRLDPANRGQAESIVRQAIAAGFHKETQNELFGAREMTSSLFLERARVLERGLARLRKMKLVYGTAAEHADTLEQVGSSIARTQSEKEAARNAQALEIVSRLAFSRGPVADALNHAAAELAGGKPITDVTRGFVDAVRGIDLQAAAKDAGRDESGRLAPDGAGRGGDAGSESSVLPSQPGDQGQPGGFGGDGAGDAGSGVGSLADDLAEASDPSPPTLFEIEATERFSDPDGEAAKAQTESLEHDARMDAEAPADKTAPFADEFARLGVPDDIRARIRDNSPPDYDVADMLARWEAGDRRRALDKVDRELASGGLEARQHYGPQPLDLVMDGQHEVAGLLRDEHPTKVLRTLHERAQDNQVELGRVGATIARDTGAELVNPGVKSLERALEKFESEGYSNPGDLKDLARLGFTITEPGQGDRIIAALGQHFPLFDKGWRPSNGFLDRKVIVRLSNGGVAELQIIPKLVAELKWGEGLDGLYKIARDPATSPGEFERVVREMKARYDAALAGSDFAALGKAAANDAGESSVPSSGALRASEGADLQAPLSKTEALSPSTDTGRSSSSNSLGMEGSSSSLDMGAKADPGKAGLDAELAALQAEAPLRPGAVDQKGEMGLGLFDAADQPQMRLDADKPARSVKDVFAELDADQAAIDALEACMKPRAA